MIRRLQIHKNELAVLSSRVVSLLVGPVTVLAVGIYLDPVLQGYYYTFGSILSASVFFEAGVSTAIVQFAAHESGHLRFNNGGAIQGPRESRLRLAAVLRFAAAWFWGAAALMGLLVVGLGYALFSTQSDDVNWQLPWALVVIVAVLAFCLQPLFAFLEGIGEVRYVYRYRTVRSLAQSLVLIICVVGGLGLYSLAIASAVACFIGFAFLIPRQRTLRIAGWSRGKGALNWKAEILPFQWRIAVSWAAGYFTVSLFTPVMMLVSGPIDAGKVGMTVTLMVACTSLAASFLQAHAPSLGSLHGAAKYVEFKFLFRRKFYVSLLVCLALLIVLVTFATFARMINLPLASRIVDPTALIVFALGFLAYHFEGLLAFFMRAQKREPYFVLEIVGAILIFPLTIVLGGTAGPFGVAAGFALVHLLVLAPTAFFIFQKSARGLGDV